MEVIDTSQSSGTDCVSIFLSTESRAQMAKAKRIQHIANEARVRAADITRAHSANPLDTDEHSLITHEELARILRSHFNSLNPDKHAPQWKKNRAKTLRTLLGLAENGREAVARIISMLKTLSRERYPCLFELGEYLETANAQPDELRQMRKAMSIWEPPDEDRSDTMKLGLLEFYQPDDLHSSPRTV